MHHINSGMRIEIKIKKKPKLKPKPTCYEKKKCVHNFLTMIPTKPSFQKNLIKISKKAKRNTQNSKKRKFDQTKSLFPLFPSRPNIKPKKRTLHKKEEHSIPNHTKRICKTRTGLRPTLSRQNTRQIHSSRTKNSIEKNKELSNTFFHNLRHLKTIKMIKNKERLDNLRQHHQIVRKIKIQKFWNYCKSTMYHSIQKILISKDSLTLVFSFLELNTILCCQLVCKEFYVSANENSCWKELFIREFGCIKSELLERSTFSPFFWKKMFWKERKKRIKDKKIEKDYSKMYPVDFKLEILKISNNPNRITLERVNQYFNMIDKEKKGFIYKYEFDKLFTNKNTK